jgi:hypothetical protein
MCKSSSTGAKASVGYPVAPLPEETDAELIDAVVSILSLT